MGELTLPHGFCAVGWLLGPWERLGVWSTPETTRFA